MNRAKTDKKLWLAAALLLLVLALHFAVNRNLTVYSDDYWYGTFFRGGLGGFVRNTVDHYKTTNGRVLVHILIPIVLLFDTKLFAVIAPPLTAALFAAGLAAQDRRLRRAPLLLGTAMAVLTVLGSEIQYLRMSLYWLSAFFNYAFPLLFPLLTLWLLERGGGEGRSGRETAALCLCALLSGMGTEQMGVVSLTALWGFWLLSHFGREPVKSAALRCALLCSAGYVTILLAPGSHARMERGIEGGVLSVLRPAVFERRFFDVMDYLCGCGFWNVLFSAVCLLSAALWLAAKRRGEKRSAALLLGFPAAAAVGLLYALKAQRPLAVVTVCATLALAGALLASRDTRVTGLLLLGGGASVMLLTVTTLYYARTFFPCVLLFIAAAWSLLLRDARLEGRPLGTAAVCGALALVLLARYLPIYRGYARNRAVTDRNLAAVAAARVGAPLVLSVDPEPDYRFTEFFEGGYFLANFLRYYRLPEDIPVRFTSELWDVSGLRLGERTAVFPALEKDGRLLLPIEFVFQALGERCDFDWTNHSFTLTRNGVTYVLEETGRLTGDGGTAEENCRYVMPFSFTYTLLYLSEEDFSRCFGISFAYDGAADEYLIVEGS